MIEAASPKFGLPPCLHIPIAARSIAALQRHVGTVETEHRYGGVVQALCIRPYLFPAPKTTGVQLWSHELTPFYENQLHPELQCWVHVDFNSYRRSYIKFGLPGLQDHFVLDHVQNREAVRIREYSHPYLRLCPIDTRVNTSGGSVYGGEGMEKDNLRRLKLDPERWAELMTHLASYDIVYADPMDLTKMCNTVPGTINLSGVGETEKLFYLPD